MFSKALLYFRTIRRLRPIQIYRRIWFRVYKPKVDLNVALTVRPSSGSWVKSARRRPSMTGPGMFSLLNEPGDLSEIEWDGPAKSKLWRYNQHYFDDLNALKAKERTEWHIELLRDWIDKNEFGNGTGWEPYPTSLRIVNWIRFAVSRSQLPRMALRSLALQASWLEKRIEWHLLGNHLFSNAKALAFAGLFFEGKQAGVWRGLAARILETQISEQFLPDGGHFELSTMYHALATEDLLDILNLYQKYKAELSTSELGVLDQCHRVIPQALDWLNAMLHPDGEISFFNDAAIGIAPAPSEIFEYALRLGFKVPAHQSEFRHLKASGYCRLQNSSAVVFVDVAEIGPSYLPGHAHADTLSFELSLHGERVIVNSGTSQYGFSPERVRQRGTSAHSTLCVEGEDTSEVWGGFRAARRARPEGIEIEPNSVRAQHSGFKRAGGKPTHSRHWVLGDKKLTILDSTGSGGRAIARYYLHPKVEVTLNPSTPSGKGSLESGLEFSFQVEGASLTIQDSTWHPEFGLRIPSKCIVLELLGRQASLTIEWGA